MSVNLILHESTVDALLPIYLCYSSSSVMPEEETPCKELFVGVTIEYPCGNELVLEDNPKESSPPRSGAEVLDESADIGEFVKEDGTDHQEEVDEEDYEVAEHLEISEGLNH